MAMDLDVDFCLFIFFPLSLAILLPDLIMSNTVGVVHETRTTYPSISLVVFFGGVCVAHPVRYLCCVLFFLFVFVLCLVFSFARVSGLFILDCRFSLMFTYKQYSNKIRKNAGNVFQIKQGVTVVGF